MVFLQSRRQYRNLSLALLKASEKLSIDEAMSEKAEIDNEVAIPKKLKISQAEHYIIGL